MRTFSTCIFGAFLMHTRYRILSIICVIVVCVIVGLSIAVSCQRDRIDALKAKEKALIADNERLREDLENAKKKAAFVEFERAKDALAMGEYLRKLQSAKSEHMEVMGRIDDYAEDQEIGDWLSVGVPAAISELLCTKKAGN